MATADTGPWIFVEHHGYIPLSAAIRLKYEEVRAAVVPVEEPEDEEDDDPIAITLTFAKTLAFGLLLTAITLTTLVSCVWIAYQHSLEIARLRSEITTTTKRVDFWVPETARGGQK